MTATRRNNVRLSGRPGARPMLFVHGFGCDQTVWRYVAPAFEEDHRVVLFDHVGCGGSDACWFAPERYASLDAYAQDILELCRELGLQEVVLVGHSVGAMMAVLAANEDPGRFAALVLVAPSPRYIDDEGYVGGFTREDVDGLLEAMEINYLGWSSAMAPVIMGADHPELGAELTRSFCRTDPDVGRQFAEVTFLSDTRDDLARVRAPTLILQCSDDVIAPCAVGAYVHEHVPGSELVVLEATGHCPHLSAPAETAGAIRAFL